VQALELQRQKAEEAASAEAHRASEHVTGTNATTTNTEAQLKNAEALAAELTKAQEAEVATHNLNNAQALLANIGLAVQAGQYSAADGARIFAAGADIAYAAAYRLVQIQAQLALSKMPTGGGLVYSTSKERLSGTGPESDREMRQSTAILDLHTQRVNAAALAEAQYQKSLGHTGPLLAYYRNQLNQTRKGSEAYYNLLTKITDLESGGKKGGGGAGAGAARLKAQGAVLDKLEDQEIKYQQRMEDATRDHEKRLAEIEVRYQEARLKAEKKFHQQELDSRADFYESLSGIEDQGLRIALSEKYEEVQRKVAEIRAKYGADAAAEYEQEATQIVTEETKLIDKIAKLRSKKDEEGKDKSKEQRKKDLAEAEYLDGVLKLKQAANAERLRQIEESGSAIETQHNKDIADEAMHYTDAQLQIMESSDRATDKIELNARRRKLAIDEENASLAKTREHYDALQGPAAAPAAPPASAAPAQGNAPNNAIAPTIWAVKDQAVVDIIGTTNTILSTGLGTLHEDNARIIERLRAVENAVNQRTGAVA
jgi:hypothetical protein